MNEESDISQENIAGWTNNLKFLPPFSFTQLQEHLITETHQDGCQKGAYKHKKLGYQLFKDGYVSHVQVKPDIKKNNGELYFLLKGTVHASMKKKIYCVYVHLLQSRGSVGYATCSCKAGKGGCCKHVAALLFQILDYIQLELSEVPDNITCTQRLQQWHVPRIDESDEPVLFEDLHFEKASFEKDSAKHEFRSLKRQATSYNPTPQFARKTNEDAIQKLAGGLEEVRPNHLSNVLRANNYEPMLYDEFHSRLPSKQRYIEDNACKINVTDIRTQILSNLQDENVIWGNITETEFVEKKLGVSHEYFLEIERNTRLQSECQRWFDERRFRLTASNFGTVIKRRKTIYPKSLLSHHESHKSEGQKTPIQCKWGKDNEITAAKKYIKRKANTVSTCTSCGLFVNRNYPWLGASPDMLIQDSSEVSLFGIGEIKCPYSKQNLAIEECCEDKRFYLHVVNGKPCLKKDHAYFYQIQGTMATLKLLWADFIVFTSVDLHVERIYLDNELWEQVMVPELTDFYFKYVFPLLI